VEETEEENAVSEEEEEEEREEKEEKEEEEKEVRATPCPRRRINAMKNNADDDRRTEEVP